MESSKNDKSIKKRRKKLRRYICPHHENYLMGGTFAVLGAVSLVICFIDDDWGLFAGVVFFWALGAFILYLAVSKTVKYRSLIASLEEHNGSQALFDDFEKGGGAFKDSIILGQKYIYGKRSGEIVAYSEITRVYQYIEKDALFENSRELCLELRGRKVKLGKLPLKGKGNEELRQVIEYICMKNPNVNVGYAG